MTKVVKRYQVLWLLADLVMRFLLMATLRLKFEYCQNYLYCLMIEVQ